MTINNIKPLSPQDMIKSYLFDFFMNRLREREDTHTAKDGTKIKSGHIRSLRFPVLADEFSRFVQSILYHNTLLGKQFLPYYCKLGDYYCRIIAEQDGSKNHPYFLATDYEIISPKYFVPEANNIQHVMNINLYQLLDNAKLISAYPLNVQSIYMMMIRIVFDIMFGKVKIPEDYS